MRGIKDVYINGLRVKQLELGGVIVYNKKRYTYYFDGQGATASFDPITVGGPNCELTITFKIGSDITVFRWVVDRCIRTYDFGEQDRFGARVAIRETDYSSTFFQNDRYLNYGYWWDSEGFTRNIIKSRKFNRWYSGNTYTDSATFTTISPDGDWHGWVKTINVNGKEIPLESLPGIHFHNVIRYELDDNGDIIESTAKILNT